MLSFTYERMFEDHPQYPELWNIRKTIRQIRENKKSGDNIHQKISRLRDRASEIEMAINAQLFDQARVIACTLVGASNKLLVGHKFSTLFIDEAAQALEPACWIAIRRASRVILAGDHQQLPPTIKSFQAMHEGLGKTLMERIAENLLEAVTLLRVQYRMNESIMRFSSNWFYQGQVESDPSVKYRSVLDFDTPIQWIDGSDCVETQDADIFREQYVGDHHGRINKAEADLMLETLVQYINKIGKKSFLDERIDIGIISPYKMQAQYLRHRIKLMEALHPFLMQITVNTVDGFQGQERDIIFISLVRSNENGEIGFLSDIRRMNVAMTRARIKLFIFGSKTTMMHHPFYRNLISYVDDVHESAIDEVPESSIDD